MTDNYGDSHGLWPVPCLRTTPRNAFNTVSYESALAYIKQRYSRPRPWTVWCPRPVVPDEHWAGWDCVGMGV